MFSASRRFFFLHRCTLPLLSTGTVVAWAHKSGYGFIKEDGKDDDDSTEIFVHNKNCIFERRHRETFRSIAKSTRVEFDVEIDPNSKKEKLWCTNVTLIGGKPLPPGPSQSKYLADKSKYLAQQKTLQSGTEGAIGIVFGINENGKYGWIKPKNAEEGKENKILFDFSSVIDPSTNESAKNPDERDERVKKLGVSSSSTSSKKEDDDSSKKRFAKLQEQQQNEEETTVEEQPQTKTITTTTSAAVGGGGGWGTASSSSATGWGSAQPVSSWGAATTTTTASSLSSSSSSAGGGWGSLSKSSATSKKAEESEPKKTVVPQMKPLFSFKLKNGDEVEFDVVTGPDRRRLNRNKTRAQNPHLRRMKGVGTVNTVAAAAAASRKKSAVEADGDIGSFLIEDDDSNNNNIATAPVVAKDKNVVTQDKNSNEMNEDEQDNDEAGDVWDMQGNNNSNDENPESFTASSSSSSKTTRPPKSSVRYVVQAANVKLKSRPRDPAQLIGLKQITGEIVMVSDKMTSKKAEELAKVKLEMDDEAAVKAPLYSKHRDHRHNLLGKQTVAIQESLPSTLYGYIKVTNLKELNQQLLKVAASQRAEKGKKGVGNNINDDDTNNKQQDVPAMEIETAADRLKKDFAEIHFELPDFLPSHKQEKLKKGTVVTFDVVELDRDEPGQIHSRRKVPRKPTCVNLSWECEEISN